MHDTTVSGVPFARVSSAITQHRVVHTRAGRIGHGLSARLLPAHSKSRADAP